MSKYDMAKRIEFIDIAKGICIILVVVGHFCPDYAPKWYLGICKVIYTFHMPLFMFASGLVYIATKKDITYKDFVCKKFKRLMIPYLSVSVILVTIKILMHESSYLNRPFTILSYIRIFYLPETGYFLWFIWVLWWIFLIVPLFRTRMSRVILFVISIVLHYADIQLPSEFCLHEFRMMFLFFMSGVVTFDWKSFYTRLAQPSIICTTIASLLFLLFVVRMTISGVSSSLLVSFIGVWFVLEISKWMSESDFLLPLKRIFNVTAESSFIIYLFHTSFNKIATTLYMKSPLAYSVNLPYSIEAIFVVVVGTLCPIILHRSVLRNYKVTKFLFGA